MSIKKRVVPIVLGAALLLACCLGIVLLARAADGAEETQSVSPVELWTLPAGVTAEADVSVPDYMLYGKEFLSSGGDFNIKLVNFRISARRSERREREKYIVRSIA